MAVQSISYNDKTDLNTTSVPDVNKVKASDLNEIKSVVNNNATELSNTENSVSALNTYSTTERAIGTWTDGKTIYRKVISGVFISTGSRQTLNLLTGVSDLINIYGLYSPNNSTPNMVVGGQEISTTNVIDSYSSFRISSGNVQLVLLVVQAAYVSEQGSYKVVVEYTKN